MNPRRGKKRPYDSTRRREQAAATREDIVAAAAEILKSGVRPEQLSFADVAERAGVAIRTVYRHFTEPTDLLREVASQTVASIIERAGEELPDAAGLGDQLARFHRNLSAEPTLFRVFIAAPVRSEARMEDRMRAMLKPVLERVPKQHQRTLIAVVELLASPFAWEVLHSSYGLSAERITRTCLASAQAIIDAMVTRPEIFDPKAPVPPFFRR